MRGIAHLLVVAFIAVVIFTVATSLVLWRKDIPVFNQQKAACTSEAKICPDGVSVGRTGPNCEFTACSSTRPSNSGLLPMQTKSDETLTPEEQKKILPLADTANWKTYSNQIYSLKYPPDWSEKANTVGTSADLLSSVVFKNNNLQFKIDIIKTTGNKPSGTRPLRLEQISLDDIKTYAAFYKSGQSYLEQIFFTRNNFDYYIEANGLNEADLSQVDQILTTFKFN